jgi:dTDP-4-amino-4,6-dideoxygalactose transaminase
MGRKSSSTPDDPNAHEGAVDPIYVAQPFLPPLNEFIPYLEKIWASRRLTNNGPFHQELEDALCEFLGVDHIALFTNGTVALVTALQALRVTGEVITTPYSFVATAHSLLWNGIRPVFVDINPTTLNIDPAKIEQAITPHTTAILPVHCYGRPCDVDHIQSIADNYNLRVIYDAAHAFGVKHNGSSLLRFGDLSVLSFHATKVFTTFEGGAIVSPDVKTKQRIDHLKNFGFVNELTVVAPGINGKMSEVCAAMGLLQLRHFNDAIARRAEIDALYRSRLMDVPGISLLPRLDSAEGNYAYFPILIGPDYTMSRDEVYEELKRYNYFTRRYFYPLISHFPMYRGLASATPSNLPVATEVAERVLCLPMYSELARADVERLSDLIACGLRRGTRAQFGHSEENG